MARRSQLLPFLARLQLALLAGAAGPAHAVSYFGPVTHWEMRDGLPSHKVMAALQTRDGYIWVGTWEGLARFDGASFTRFDAGRTPGLVESSVTALCESPDGALWIGHSSGAVTRMRQEEVTYHPVPPTRDGARIQNLASDENGDVWACDVAGHLFRVRDDLTLIPETGSAGGIFFMAGSRDGSMAVISRGRLSILAEGKLHPIDVRANMDPFIRGVCSSRDGGWWAVEDGRLRKWKSGAWTALSRPVPTGPVPVFTMTELRDGRLVGATYDTGAWIIDPTAASRPEQRFTHANGFVSNWVTTAFEDHEGGVWLATGTAGLCRVADKKVRMLAPADAFGGRPVLTVTEGSNGALWMGTEGSGIYRFHDDTWTRFPPASGLYNTYVWSMTETPDGTMWAGTWGGGVFRFHEERFSGPESGTATAWAQVAAIIPSARGGLLVGELTGIYRWNGTDATWLESGATRKATNVRALLEEDGGDVLWAGCWGRGLVQFAPSGIRQYSRADGLSSNDVNCLYRDRSGALWIGTNGDGVNRLKDGRIDVVRSVHGLSDNSIGHIAEEAGSFWLSSRSGLMRVSAAQLHACADGELVQLDIENFGYSDGLTTLNFSASAQPTGCTLRNGELAFATDRGVALIDPAQLPRNSVPPPVYIESVTIGGHRIVIGDDAARTCEVPAGFARLEIKYTALSFAGPEKVVFSRQLHPLERQPTVVRGERSVVYNYLPAGTYTFRVAAANNDGVWNPEARSVTLVVLPFFWETVWFRTLGAVLLVAVSGTIAWYVSRRRLQRRLERLEHERAIERERTRIAHDMHDELGSQLTRISMLSESARRQTADPARVDERLGQIYDTAREVTKAMDEIVWTVNPKHDTLDSLVTYLEKYAVDFLGTAGVACRIDAPFETIAWTPNAEVRHNLFLCLKEALTNIIRHSGAGMVVLTIRANDMEFSMQIADNGRGLPSGDAAPATSSRVGGGNGLMNLRARMTRMGGSCAIDSQPGTGCTITLKMPLSIAAEHARHSDL